MVVTGVATLGLVLSACGGDDESSLPQASVAETSAAVDSTGAAASFNDSDVVFAQSMIRHHEQAIEMADIALDPSVAAGPEVVDLANRINAAQDPEIQVMTQWLTAWDQPVEMDTTGEHGMDNMDGMMTAEEMDALAGMTGPDFDRMWMEMMIAHHEGAIAMAQTVQAAGSNPDVIALAGEIISAQQGEIDEMQALLAG